MSRRAEAGGEPFSHWVPKNIGPASLIPSGLRRVSWPEQQVDVPKVTFARFSVRDCRAVPVKVRRAFCPGTATFHVNGAPPTVSEPVPSGGTS